jgi:hypothetical protein
MWIADMGMWISLIPICGLSLYENNAPYIKNIDSICGHSPMGLYVDKPVYAFILASLCLHLKIR